MVSAEHLAFSYTAKAPYVLRDLNLEIRDGEYVSIVGENGCGKSTLMRLILRLLRPTAGTVSTLARHIGYVPQRSDFSNAAFPITVYELLNSYRKLLRLRDRSIVSNCLTQVGMQGYAGALMGALSGGQTQKILIARALMGNPDLLILDEPSTGVDIDSQREIYGLLCSLNRRERATILSVEHNLQAAVANSTLIYHMVDGGGHLCSVEQYTKEYLKTSPQEAPLAPV